MIRFYLCLGLSVLLLSGCEKRRSLVVPIQDELNLLAKVASQEMKVGYNSAALGPAAAVPGSGPQQVLDWFGTADRLLLFGLETQRLSDSEYERYQRQLEQLSGYDWYVFTDSSYPEYLELLHAADRKVQADYKISNGP